MSILSEGPRRRQHIVNPYHVLQVRQDATFSEIRQHYRRLALWHHPGRCCSTMNHDDVELARRAQIFEILAACYETLIYHRTEYNTCFHSLQHPPLEGVIHVGGKRMVVFGSLDHDDYEVVPTLAISQSSDSEDGHHEGNGPMELLYQAREYEPFTNPYDVFEQVFGHDIFPRPPEEDQQRRYSEWDILDDPILSSHAKWTGSTVKRHDGTTVSYTSRVVQNRKVTRTETTSVDEKGRKVVQVNVTSEAIPRPDESMLSTKGCKCWSSTAEEDGALAEESSFCSWPEMNELASRPCKWLFPPAE